MRGPAVPAGAEVLVTTDMLMDGRHFRLGEATADEVGYKAPGGEPLRHRRDGGRAGRGVRGGRLAEGSAVAVAKGLHDGMAPLAEAFGVTLAGGDTNAWDGPLVVTITLLGEATASGPSGVGGPAGRCDPGDGPARREPAGPPPAALPRVAEALAIAEPRRSTP